MSKVLDDLRVLLATRSGQVPLGLQLVLPRGLQRVHGIPAQRAAQVADSLTGGGEVLLQIFAHTGILASGTDTEHSVLWPVRQQSRQPLADHNGGSASGWRHELGHPLRPRLASARRMAYTTDVRVDGT